MNSSNAANKKKSNNGVKGLSQDWDFDYVSSSENESLEYFGTNIAGLSEKEAQNRLKKYGFNELARKKKRKLILEFLSKFLNPLVIILVVIAVFSFYFGEPISAILVGSMAVIGVLVSFFQEHKASKEVEKLIEMVRNTSTVYRNGRSREIKVSEIVPGDITDLYAGDMIPADLRIITCKDLFINQSSLTGESLPVEKISSPVKAENKSSAYELKNIAFMGSSVVSGTALGVVIKTGVSTQFGEISKRLVSMSVQSSFDKGVKKFVWLMIRLMVILILVIFAINYFIKGNTVEAIMFSLAVAVGLTPEMLPTLVAQNLSNGAKAMSKKEVIVKRLNSIQNFGAMDILCTDKTGTLTEDKIILEKHCNVHIDEDAEVLKYAFINSYYQTGLKGPIDKAILKHEQISLTQYKKVDEVPFDFSRRIMSVIVDDNGKHMLIAKGSTEEIYRRCTKYEMDGKTKELDKQTLQELRKEYEKLNRAGFRVIAVAYKQIEKNKQRYKKDDEKDLILKGYAAFLDPPKQTAKKTIALLKKYGIKIKVLTGDNEILTEKICNDVGIDSKVIITGDKIEKATDAELTKIVESASIFARLTPMHKQRIINALQKNKHVVGFLGDGINDALALKAADVGISVNNAVDIAKESADIILLKKSLGTLADGVIEGRKSFGNILKYIKMGASSNFGNMFSMTGASLFLPFLPMLPIQILLNNFLYDMSQIAIPSDEVDIEYTLKERPWNVDYIKKFILIIGPISSIFDFITFGVMLWVFKAPESLFHTGWFLESLCTQTLIIHVIRTGKIPFLESKPSQFLAFTSIYIVTLGLVIPFTPLGKHFGFVMPPASYFLFLIGIVALYMLTVQIVKNMFIKKYGYE